jgi:hypothetical protein
VCREAMALPAAEWVPRDGDESGTEAGCVG